MSDADEFTRYRLMYEDLQRRVERLSLYNQLYGELKARVEDLAKQVGDFPGLEELAAELEELTDETAVLNVERSCLLCGEAFLTHMDVLLCPECQDK
jgi:hypothetical protein